MTVSAPVEVVGSTVRSRRLIAIRRQSAVDPGDTDSSLEILTSTEVQGDALSTMADVGLQEAAKQTPDDVRKGTGSYVSLPLAECLVLEADEPGQLLEAQDALKDDYLLVPDIPLSLPEPPDGQLGEPLAAAAAPTAGQHWPDVTGIEEARDAGQTGKDTIIAVLDSGCDADHAAFANRVVDFAWVPLALGAKVRPVRGFDTAGHGTHVCGIAAGHGFGLAPDAALLVASVIESERTLTSLDRILRGLNWILRRITSPELRGKPVVLNLSLGFKREWLAPADVQPAMIGVRHALLLMTQTFGVLPVAAIGNDGAGNVRAPGYFPEVLSVGSVDAELEPAPFSGGGQGPPPFEDPPSPDVAGLGVEIASSVERTAQGDSIYGHKSGTSMASPYVSGIAALVAGATRMQGDALRQHLEQHVHPLHHPRERVGAGLVRFAL